MPRDEESQRQPSAGPPAHGSSRAEQEEIRVGWRMAALAMEVAAQVGGGAVLGWLFDRWQGTTSGVLIGAVAGIVVGLFSLIRGALKLNKQLERSSPTTGRGKPLPFKEEEDKIDSEDD
jgi:F0F1-type ATP synthase assembly protein I